MRDVLTNSRELHVVTDTMQAPWEEARTPVVFHHGIGIDHRIWSRWIPIIAEQRPAWRFDMRGFGASPQPSGDHEWSLEELVDDVLSVIDQTGADKVHLVGESFGGTVVLAVAARHPDRVASVQISNASFKGRGLGELGNWRNQFDDGGPEGWSRRMMTNRFGPEATDLASLDWFEVEQAKTKPHVAIGLGGVLSELDLSSEIRRLDVPLSVVLPDASPFVPVSHGAEILQLTAKARLRVVPGCRHGLVFSQAQSEAEIYSRWLKQLEG